MALDEWSNPWNPLFRQYKYSEALIRDKDGVEYVFAAAVLGNRYLSAGYAWLTDGEKWYEVYRNDRMKLRCEGANIWSRDGGISFFGDINYGREIQSKCNDVQLELFLKPGREPDIYRLKQGSLDFLGYIYLGCGCSGKINLVGSESEVYGVGTNEYFSGFFGGYTSWRYFSVLDDDFSIFASDACFGGISHNKFIMRGRDEVDYDSDSVKISLIDEGVWMALAEGEGSSFRAEVQLVKSRPSNLNQPYMDLRLGPWKLLELSWKEHLVQVKGQYTRGGDIIEFKSKGIAEEMHAKW